MAQTPLARFSASVLEGCGPLSVRFTDESTGNPTHWNWEIDDGIQQQLSNQQHPVLTLSRPGTYTVTLMVRNANGVNAVTRTDYITVYASPSVQIAADIRTGCLPARVQFTGTATTAVGSIVSWLWNFGDGTSSTAQNPSHTYTEAGWYNVSLTVTSSSGCSASSYQSRYIRIVTGIESKFSYTPSTSCSSPFPIPFTNESSGPGALTYAWDFGNGNTSTERHPIFSFPTSGTHNVTLTTTSSFGCTDTQTQPVSVNTFNTAFTHPDTVCVNQPVSFQNTSDAGVVSFNWQFGDGSGTATEGNPVKRYATPGVYTVKLINRFGSCTDSATRQIVVTALPSVDFTVNNNNGCGTSYSVGFVSNAPTAVAWAWDFGDGTTSAEENPTHAYASTGNYNISLTITTAGGCQSTITRNNAVQIRASVARIVRSNASGCVSANIPVNFSVQTNVSAGASYFWDFGNGTTSNQPAPSVIFNSATPVIYDVRLTVTTAAGCVLTDAIPFAIGAQPQHVDFSATASGSCASEPVRFSATATGTVTEWIWAFSDGDTVRTNNPVYEHTFKEFGPVGATLVALHWGCPSAPITKSNVITLDAPVANFGFALDCNNRLAVTLTDSSRIEAGTTYEWNFGDGSPLVTTASPGIHTYATIGDYNIRLQLTNGSCTSTVSKNVDLSPLDNTFIISKNILCKAEAIRFTANEDSANVRDFRWHWPGISQFNGGKVVDTAFHSVGDIPVTLYVRDHSGCEASSTQLVKVTGPTAGFSLAAPADCKNVPIVFTDASVHDPAVAIANYRWDFGDGTVQTLTGGPFTHQYADTGVFVVRLSVTDVAGCSDENLASRTIRISGPSASFSAADTRFCPGTPLTFNNTSQGTNLTHSWNFGDSHTSSETNPSHAFTAGQYTVKLLVTDDVGCKDSLTRTNYIEVIAPVAAFDVQDSTSICPLLEAKFLHTSQHYESLFWDFGDTYSSTQDASTVRHFYDDYGSYNVRLLAYGYGGGCADTATFTVNVYNPSTFTTFNYTVDPFYCNEHTVSFEFDVPSTTNYQFFFGDGTVDSSGAKTLQHTYNYPRGYRPYVFLRDAVGCQTNVNGPHTIDIRGAVPAFNLDRKNFCDSGTVAATNFTVSSEPVTSWLWDFGTGSAITERDPYSFTYTGPGLYPVSLTATTISGCSQVYTDTVRVPRTPEPRITLDNLTCAEQLLALNGNLAYPDTAIRWNWNFGDGRTSTSQNNAIQYSNAGNYNISLSATNFLGCAGSTTHSLTVAPLPVITAPPVKTIVGSGVVLPVSYSPGIITYSWSPPDGLSCTDCPAPLANPTFTQTYTVTVTDTNSCQNKADITVEVVCTNENYFVPNTFSPNGDGMNDIFYPRGRGLARVQSMRIFNRWGQQVYERKNFMANDPSQGWDGKMRGQPLPSDAYVYVIEFVCDNANVVPFKGNVTLIR